jgi:hypothetical protein
MSQVRTRFSNFYHQVFLPEHQHIFNVALHVIGTFASTAIPFVAWAIDMPLLILLYPVVHVLPGLVGHRLFERSSGVGDVRLTRKDYPLVWFMIGNHCMTWELMTKGLYWRSSQHEAEP